jgi:hypothetical protein
MKQRETSDSLTQSAAKPCFRDWVHRVMALTVRLMQHVLATLRNTDRSIPGYVWRAFLILVIPAGLVNHMINSIINLLGPRPATITDATVSWMVSWWYGPSLAVWCWVETLVMWPILSLLKRALGTSIWVPVASGLIWGGIHVATGPQWGVSQAWAFFVFSMCFLAWEKKSKGHAVLVTGLVHLFDNMVTFVRVMLVLWT